MFSQNYKILTFCRAQQQIRRLYVDRCKCFSFKRRLVVTTMNGNYYVYSRTFRDGIHIGDKSLSLVSR